MRSLPMIMLIALGVSGCNDAARSTPSTTARTGTAVNADNTAVNERDRDTSTTTPLDQKENRTDIDITASIRKQVVATKMSVNAQNVKIITQDAQVTLRGPVKSEEEKKKIEEIAHSVAGADKVDSQLEIEHQP